jgi:hypothetical protein
MMKKIYLWGIGLLLAGQISCKNNQNKGVLSTSEPQVDSTEIGGLHENDSWESLMSPEKWRGYNQDTLPANWQISDSLISCFGMAGDVGGDIISTKMYENFELSWSWKISPEGNSGVFYHVIRRPHLSFTLSDCTGVSAFGRRWLSFSHRGLAKNRGQLRHAYC